MAYVADNMVYLLSVGSIFYGFMSKDEFWGVEIGASNKQSFDAYASLWSPCYVFFTHLSVKSSSPNYAVRRELIKFLVKHVLCFICVIFSGFTGEDYANAVKFGC